jgi:hypothetical protein
LPAAVDAGYRLTLARPVVRPAEQESEMGYKRLMKALPSPVEQRNGHAAW